MPHARRQLGPCLLDQIFAAIALLTLSPLLLLVALVILAEDGRPIFFRQKRVGQFGRLFEIWKFRSMRRNNRGPAITAAGDSRVLKTGKYLRKYKIDELPQLWNVVKGEMRVVGPRPEVPEFVDYTLMVWRSVLSVPPGITDVATLVYRNEEQLLSSAEAPEELYRSQLLPAKLQLNLKYLTHRRFSNDVKLIFITLWYCTFPHRLNAERVTASFPDQNAAKHTGSNGLDL